MDNKKVYTQSFEVAVKNDETNLFYTSGEFNRECVKAIDEAIRACNYDMYFYKFSDAVNSVVEQFGFDRTNYVLAASIQHHAYDGRYSQDNKKWANGFEVPKEIYTSFVFDSHPTVLDGFVKALRKSHIAMMVEVNGQYEKSHHMAERNRLTFFHSDFGVFAPYTKANEERILERYNEIVEKKSVLAQIRASRNEQKQQIAPVPDKEKKKQGPEL